MKQTFTYGKGLPYVMNLQAFYELPYWAQWYQKELRDKM